MVGLLAQYAFCPSGVKGGSCPGLPSAGTAFAPSAPTSSPNERAGSQIPDKSCRGAGPGFSFGTSGSYTAPGSLLKGITTVCPCARGESIDAAIMKDVTHATAHRPERFDIGRCLS